MPKKIKPAGVLEPLKAAIKSSGLTSYALGKAAGVSPIGIDRFLSGERGISGETADKLALALGLTLERADAMDKSD